MSHVTTSPGGALITDVHTFVHRGREYRIYKWRGQENFYIRKQHRTFNPKGTPFNLKSPIKSVAIANAKVYLDAMLSERFDQSERWQMLNEWRGKPHWSKCGDIMDAFTARSRLRDPRDAVLNFIHVIAEGLGLPQEPIKAREARVRELGAEVICRKTMRAFRDRQNTGRSPTSTNTMMRTARALFQREAWDYYEHLRLPREEIQGFCNVAFLPDHGRRTQRFPGIPPEILEKMDAAMEAMRAMSPKIWATYALMRRCGLRNSEVADARWHWFEPQTDGSYRLHIRARPEDPEEWRKPAGYYKPKGIPGWLPVSAELYRSLREALGVDDERGYLLGEDRTQRKAIVEREINVLLKPWLGSMPGKAVSYNLRKQFGSEMAALYDFPTVASLMRHADPKTTWDHYFAPLNAELVAPR